MLGMGIEQSAWCTAYCEKVVRLPFSPSQPPSFLASQLPNFPASQLLTLSPSHLRSFPYELARKRLTLSSPNLQSSIDNLPFRPLDKLAAVIILLPVSI